VHRCSILRLRLVEFCAGFCGLDNEWPVKRQKSRRGQTARVPARTGTMLMLWEYDSALPEATSKSFTNGCSGPVSIWTILFSNQHNSLRERLDSDKNNGILGQSINVKVDCAEAAHEHDEHVFALVVRSPPLTLITFCRISQPMIVHSTHITSMWLSKKHGL
jgi:hypothetical protein